MIELRRIKTYEEVASLMPFFLEGYEWMVRKANATFSRDAYIKTIFGVLNTYPENGILVAYKNDEPVGFGIAFDNTAEYETEKVFLLYALYSKGVFGRVPRKLLDECLRVAKELGYKRVEAHSARMSGSAIKFYTKTLGLTKQRIVYTKEL